MELRTYTGLWRVERKIYRLYDWNLPFPVSGRQIAITAIAFVPWLAFLGFIHLPFSTPFQVVWILPPAAIVYFTSKPLIENKTAGELLSSQIRYLLQSRRYTRLERNEQPEVVYVHTSRTVRVRRNMKLPPAVPGMSEEVTNE